MTPPRTIYRSLGHIDTLEVDIIGKHFEPNSHLLICNNELIGWNWEYIKEPEIQTILRDNDPQTASDRLVALARERDGSDNITALVVKVETV